MKQQLKSILMVDNPGLELLKMAHKYPRLVLMSQTPQDPEWHPEGSVLAHTAHALNHMATLTDRLDLRLAILCHDMGKPECTVKHEVHGRWVSPKHDHTFYATRDFLVGNEVSPDMIDFVEVLTNTHMRFISVDKNVSAKSVRKLVAKLEASGATMEDWANVVESDMSGRPPLPIGRPELITHILDIASRPVPVKVAALLTGQDMIGMGLSPGPIFGEIQMACMEAEQSGIITNHDEAMTWLQVYIDAIGKE